MEISLLEFDKGVDKHKIRCQSLLYNNGLKQNEMGFDEERAKTFVMEVDGEIKGFFTLRKENGLPYVVHFVAEKGYGLKLGEELKRALKYTKAPRALISIRCGDKRLFNGVRRMLHGKLYDAKDGHYFFYMEINHGKIEHDRSGGSGNDFRRKEFT